MKNTFNMLISFCFGGAVGGGIAYFLLKKKFNARIDEEVQSVKELYSNKIKEQQNTKANENISKIEPKVNTENDSNNKDLKHSIIKQEKKPPVDYVNYYSNSKPENNDKDETNAKKAEAASEKKPSKKNTPVVISPDEFESEEDYRTIYLTYFADGILADEMDNPVKIESTIGKEALKHFGDYEDDTLHVRADKVKIYYEVTKDNRRYADVVGNDTDGEDEED